MAEYEGGTSTFEEKQEELTKLIKNKVTVQVELQGKIVEKKALDLITMLIFLLDMLLVSKVLLENSDSGLLQDPEITIVIISAFIAVISGLRSYYINKDEIPELKNRLSNIELTAKSIEQTLLVNLIKQILT